MAPLPPVLELEQPFREAFFICLYKIYMFTSAGLCIGANGTPRNCCILDNLDFFPLQIQNKLGYLPKQLKENTVCLKVRNVKERLVCTGKVVIKWLQILKDSLTAIATEIWTVSLFSPPQVYRTSYKLPLNVWF